MIAAILLAVAAAVVAVSLASPTLRRIWAFGLYTCKYLLLGMCEVVQLRRLGMWLRNRRFVPLSRPRAARLFCEDMGPTFIKFGQIIASSSGMFPDAYVREFQRCLDRVRPFSFTEVREIIESELGAERAQQLVNVEPKPLASASIAQVHTAELADGTKLVVKVQRPGIDGRISADMRIMRTAAAFAASSVRDAELANPVGVVEDFASTLREELDFRLEAHNLDRFNEIMGELGYRDIRAPVPNWQLTTRRVLVMERFFGTRVDAVDEIHARGIDAEASLVKGMRAWFQCVILYGFFHGDVHAGNLMLLDNDDLGFLDFGIVGRFDDEQRRLVTDYIVAFATGDYRTLAQVITEMGGVKPDDLDMDAFVADLEEAYSPLLKLSFAELNYADLLPRIHKVARRHQMTMPKEFVLITKQMLYFDRYAKALAPKLNVFNDPRLVMSLMADIGRARAEQAQSAPSRAQA